MEISIYLKECQKRAKKALLKRLPSPNKKPTSLNQALRYAALNGGKRLRSAFIYATGETLGAKNAVLNDISAAVEMIHTYSLIHDDLPSLDNDDLRRGQPTCHKVFGVSTAILAGDALQSLAFETISQQLGILPEIQLKMVHILSRAIGPAGMIGGEELDLKMVNQTNISLKELETMYRMKTGYLLKTSILLGAYASNCKDKKLLNHLESFGDYIGLAFQIHDDIIGIESDTKTLGKKQGADLELNKPVYPAIAGMTRAKRREKFLYEKAMNSLNKTGLDTRKLQAIAEYVIERNY